MMQFRLPTLAALLVAGLGAACEDSTAPGTTVSASVTVNPVPNATGVSRSDTIVMVANLAMDTASCRPRFTLHVGDSAGAAVAGHVLYGSGYRHMMFVPDSILQPLTRYFAQMRDSVTVGDGMGGMSSEGMMGGQHQTMMFTQMPAGAMRTGSGMGWYFTTGSQ